MKVAFGDTTHCGYHQLIPMTCHLCYHAEVPQIPFEFHEGNDEDLCFSESIITVVLTQYVRDGIMVEGQMIPT